ncbi:MAG TPA: LTA synthase family protein [Gemmatimonadales bacterium]
MTTTERTSGAQELSVTLGLAALAWLVMGIQEILLFARPAPYGGPYVIHPIRYFPYALFYNLLGVMIVAAPVAVAWLVWYHRPVRPVLARRVHLVELWLLMLVVALDHADNEVLRFMGIHLTRSLLLTYFRVNAWDEDMGHIFATDKGGPGLPFVLLLVMPLALWWLGRRLMRNAHQLPRLRPRALAAAVALLPLAVPLYFYNYKTMGVNRMIRVQPEIVTLYAEARKDLAAGERPAQLDSLAREYQRNWFANSNDTAWRFSDPERPLIRVPVGAQPRSEKPWNIIYIQLETFRGWNTGFLRPDTTSSVTPFLDSLATRSGKAGYWRRHLSMGPPTVSGFVSGLCSIKPHSFYNITNQFTYTSLECLPSVLRRHGYHAEYFTGFDPDWDGETIWVRRWFDDYTFNRAGGDRVLFHRAADRIREMARGSKPWMITIASATNHIPFRSPEPRFVVGPADKPNVAIRYTMRYTDDVLREFFDSLKREPWFSRTLVVITGDHGYNLGEHGPAGQLNGYRETVWVPLIMYGEHPRLPRGPRDEPASLLDIAPTLSDLVGIRDPNPWMGSSLLTQGRSPSFVLQRETATLGEKDRYSMVVDPSSGRAQVFDAFTDPLQRHDIFADHRAFADSLRRRAGDERVLTDYLLEANKVWPDSTHAPPSAAVVAR